MSRPPIDRRALAAAVARALAQRGCTAGRVVIRIKTEKPKGGRVK